MSDLWILAGQSNMEGVALLEGVESPSEAVRVFAHGDRWEMAREPLHWLMESSDLVHAELWQVAEADLPRVRQEMRTTRTNGAGLGLSFGKRLAEETGVGIDLLPCAHGGTSMDQWSPQKKEEGGRSLYGAMLRRVRVALETGGDIRLAGVLWYQGESEAYADGARVYYDRMKLFIDELRHDLGEPNLPFFLVQLGVFAARDSADWGNSTAWSSIRESQRRLPLEVRHTGLVPAIDLELDDPIHIGTQGLKRLGRRLANVALASVYGKSAPAGIALSSAVRKGATIRIRFGGVQGALRVPDPAGRVSGFAIKPAGEPPEAAFIYKARLAPDDPAAVELLVAQDTPLDARVCYGWGLFPFCQLVDEADMAAPAFGPIAPQ